MAEQDVRDWPASDVLVSYNARTNQVLFTSISTRKLLHAYDVTAPDGLKNGDVITPQEVVRPEIDLSPIPLWRRIWWWLKLKFST